MPAAVDSSTKRGASTAVSPAFVSARPTARTTASATSAPPTAPSTSHIPVRPPRSGRPVSRRGSRLPPSPGSAPVSLVGPTPCIRPLPRDRWRARLPDRAFDAGPRAGRQAIGGLQRAQQTAPACVAVAGRTDCAALPECAMLARGQAPPTECARPLDKKVVDVYPRSRRDRPVRRTGKGRYVTGTFGPEGGVQVLRRRIWALLALSVILLAACSDDGGGERERPATRPAEPPAATSTSGFPGTTSTRNGGPSSTSPRSRRPCRPAARSTSPPTRGRPPSSSWPTSRT